ncbi:MAG: hypothetical protein ABIT05_01675 [Chitinophagaceae bacterium]
MNAQINQLVRSLLQKDTLEQCSLQELEQFADRHPYFGAAQLLLTKKLQTESPERYDEQLQKTFLFFHNPLWVEHLLNDTGKATVTIAERKEDTPVKNSIPEIIPAPAQLVEKEITEEKVQVVIIKEEIAEPAIPPPASLPRTEEPPMQIPALKMESHVTAANDFVFEPYHTVDYFASQGIKFREEEKPKDKFGQQLKSFTDWLKTMKRLPVAEITKTVETGAEQKVEQLAEHSLEEREILTETMAEVWEKQGNKEKAIDIYAKLSLLDPSKSPYFAAKIEALKKTN